MNKNNSVMAVCPNCSSRLYQGLTVDGGITREYLCGAVYRDDQFVRRPSGACAEIKQLRAERDAAVKELRKMLAGKMADGPCSAVVRSAREK